jgi:hypothetical protein
MEIYYLKQVRSVMRFLYAKYFFPIENNSQLIDVYSDKVMKVRI